MNRTEWTPEEDDLLMSKFEAGVRMVEIFRNFPNRTYAAAKARLAKLRGEEGGRNQGHAAIARATAKLYEALMDAFVAHSNRTGLSMAEVQHELLGENDRAPVPGTERIYKTAQFLAQVEPILFDRQAA
jgi:hypothetical protein